MISFDPPLGLYSPAMPDRPDAPLLRHAPARVHGRYLVRAGTPGAGGLWLVGFHGQRQTAEMRRRRWKNITDASRKVWRKHRPDVVRIITQQDPRTHERL